MPGKAAPASEQAGSAPPTAAPSTPSPPSGERAGVRGPVRLNRLPHPHPARPSGAQPPSPAVRERVSRRLARPRRTRRGIADRALGRDRTRPAAAKFCRSRRAVREAAGGAAALASGLECPPRFVRTGTDRVPARRWCAARLGEPPRPAARRVDRDALGRRDLAGSRRADPGDAGGNAGKPAAERGGGSPVGACGAGGFPGGDDRFRAGPPRRGRSRRRRGRGGSRGEDEFSDGEDTGEEA